LLATTEWARVDAFVRICGDSPFVDPIVVDKVIELFDVADVDLATNILVRTFPKGLSVEAIHVSALRRAQALMTDAEREHVTPAFYRCPQSFRIVGLTSGHDWGAIQMSIDTADDFLLAERMMAALERSFDRIALTELVQLRQRCLALSLS
jgi:spore coat polysaccharide biosynthesis protein SpsF